MSHVEVSLIRTDVVTQPSVGFNGERLIYNIIASMVPKSTIFSRLAFSLLSQLHITN